jgi:hypothetical protein
MDPPGIGGKVLRTAPAAYRGRTGKGSGSLVWYRLSAYASIFSARNIWLTAAEIRLECFHRSRVLRHFVQEAPVTVLVAMKTRRASGVFLLA